jgi:hypothetical protein
VDIPDKPQPFRISIWDSSGKDIYQAIYADERKNGKSLKREDGRWVKTLSLQLGESKFYDFKITMVPDAKGAMSRLNPGKYKVDVRLPTVKYENGVYQTKIYSSNQVGFTAGN